MGCIAATAGCTCQGPPRTCGRFPARLSRRSISQASEATLNADIDVDAAVAARLKALERYWDPSGGSAAYSSDVRGARLGGDRYYDDNAWVGLALVQLERMRPGSGYLDRADELFRFAV